MQQTKLIELLRCFSPKEIKQFDSFLQSPYFNKSELLLRFYRLLSAHHPQFDSAKLDKEKVYAKLYGAGIYKDKTMRDATSQLYQMANDFIAHESLSNDALEFNRLRYMWLAEKGTEKLRRQAIEHSEKLLDESTTRDSRFYLHRWLTDFNEFEFKADHYIDLEYKLEHETDLVTHIHSLDKYYVIKGLETQLYILSVCHIYGRKFDHGPFDHIDALAQKYAAEGDVVIELYYNLLQFDKTREERYYQLLKTNFFTNDPVIPRALMKDIYVSLVSYSSKAPFTGDKLKVATELMEIFSFVIEHGLMIYKGEVSYAFYQNVVLTVIKLGQHEWLDKFMEEYKSMMPPKHRDEVYTICKTYVLFDRKHFDDALHMALSVTTTMYFNKVDIKALLARIYFELALYPQLDVVLDSYKYNLSDTNMPPTVKEGHTNFVKSIRMLVELKQNYSHDRFEKATKYFNQKIRLPAASWFLAKLKEFEK